MYEYKFVKVPAVYRGTVLVSSSYEATVEEYACNGWRFVQMIFGNPLITGYREHNLIFERAKPGPS